MSEHIEEKKEKVNHTSNEIIWSKEWEKYRDADYFDYRKKWSEYPNKRIVSDFPLHLDIETTDLCNLKCPFCSHTIKDNEGIERSKYISKEEYIRIIDQAAKYGCKSIKLQYSGEPLLHKDIIFQVEYAKKKGIIDVMFNTNATLLTKEMSRKLLEAGLDKIFISFDAANPKLYAQQRVGTTMGKVIDNVYEFVKLRNEISPKTFIRLSMIMYDDPVWKQQFEAMKVMWDGVIDALGYGLYVERRPDMLQEYEPVDGFACEQLFQRMMLKCNGNITVCCTDEDDTFCMGNWKTDDLSEVWNSKKYQQLRQNHIDNKYHKHPTCRTCLLPEGYRIAYQNK